MKKRVFALLAAVVFALSLAACGGSPAASSVPASPAEPAPSSPSPSSPSSPSSSSRPESRSAPASGGEQPPESGAEPAPEQEAAPAAPAVVYFSATGTTAKVAELIAAETGGSLFEIVPEVPYTAADLAYTNNDCRANKEMEDAAARPAIGSDLSGVSGCEAVYLGYPIWWGTAPRIIQTFLDSGALDGATVYLFCTSGGSGVEQSVRDLQGLYPRVNIVGGRRLNGASQADVQEWITGLSENESEEP